MPIDVRGTKAVIDDMLAKLGGQRIECPEPERQAKYRLLYVACRRFVGSARKAIMRWDRYAGSVTFSENVRPRPLTDWDTRLHGGDSFRLYHFCDPDDLELDDVPSLLMNVSIKERYFGRDALVIVWLFDGIEDEDRFSEEDRQRAYRLGVATFSDETVAQYQALGIQRAHFDITDDDLRWLDHSISHFSTFSSGGFESLLRLAHVSETLLRGYMGDVWTKRHAWAGFDGNARGKSFGRFGAVNLLMSEKHLSRIVALAEMLYNLQGVPGIQERVRTLRTEDIESVLGELQGAQLLFASGRKISFVTPNNIKGESYDMDAYLSDGTPVACEIKTKFENTDFSEATVKRTVERACAQLPVDRITAVLIKVPEHWLDQIGSSDMLEEVAQNVFKQRSRVSAIFFHWEKWTELEIGTHQTFTLNPNVNPNAQHSHSELESLIKPPLPLYKRLIDGIRIPKSHVYFAGRPQT